MALAERMSREVEVRDRQWRLKKYRACFVGREAVRWLTRTANVAPSEDDAVALGNAMLQLGLIAHVVRPGGVAVVSNLPKPPALRRSASICPGHSHCARDHGRWQG